MSVAHRGVCIYAYIYTHICLIYTYISYIHAYISLIYSEMYQRTRDTCVYIPQTRIHCMYTMLLQYTRVCNKKTRTHCLCIRVYIAYIYTRIHCLYIRVYIVYVYAYILSIYTRIHCLYKRVFIVYIYASEIIKTLVYCLYI